MVLVVFIYAGNILVGKAINDLPPFTIAFFRLLVALFILFPIGYRSAWQARSTFITYKKPFLVMTFTGVALFNTFIYGAIHFTTAANVSVLETVIPVVTVILSAWLLKERLQSFQWAGVVISFIGAIWVVMDGKVFALASIDWNIGDAIMIGAIGSWAVYSIFVKQYMHLFPHFGALFVMTGISVVALFPIVIIEWMIHGFPPLLTFQNISGLLYLGIFPSFIALIFYNRAVDLLSASEASVFLNFLPVITMTGAYFWLGESITVMQIVGSLVVISGVILTTQLKGKRQNVEIQSRKTYEKY